MLFKIFYGNFGVFKYFQIIEWMVHLKLYIKVNKVFVEDRTDIFFPISPTKHN